MNRQIRRAQEKQDKKADKEKERRREVRREKIQQARSRRLRTREEAKRRATSGEAPPKPEASAAPATKGSKKPGRFAGALMMATVFFIVLNSAATAETAGGDDLLRTITSAGFYLLFGYFSVLWLMRRGTPRPLMMTLISGAFLTIGVEVAKLFQPEAVTDPLMLALAVPGMVAGAYLGRLVYVNSPA
jgi:hypothetical protein